MHCTLVDDNKVATGESITTSKEPFEVMFKNSSHRFRCYIRPECLKEPLPNPLPDRIMIVIKEQGVYVSPGCPSISLVTRTNTIAFFSRPTPIGGP